MKYFCFSCLVFFLVSCGGSETTNPETSSSPSAVDLVNTDTIYSIDESYQDDGVQKLLISGQSTHISLDDLDIDSRFNINIESENSAVVREGSSLLITAPEVDHFTMDSININMTDEDGNTSSTSFEIAYFPHHNGQLGWSLQGTAARDKVNLVILGDGYRQEDKLLFFKHIDLIVEEMEKDAGIGPYMSAWSVHGIFTPSVDAGIDGSKDDDSKETFFDSYFGCFDIERLICTNSDRASALVDSQYDNYDVVAMIVNDDRRGGAGGSLAIFSYKNVHTALHELGHTFAGLADEYVDESISDLYAQRYVEGNFPNVSQNADPKDVPWQHWIDDEQNYPTSYEDGVGIFTGSYYHASGFYRPTRSSVMRNSASPFGPINTEAWVRNIYKKSPPLQNFYPSQTTVTASVSESITFSIDISFDLTLQNVRWFVNGREQTELSNELFVELELSVGRHAVSVITDDVASVRDWVGQNVYQSTNWEVEVTE